MQTVNGHTILLWRTRADGKEEAYIEAVGWCWYSRTLGAILIDGAWETFEEHNDVPAYRHRAGVTGACSCHAHSCHACVYHVGRDVT